MYWKYFILFPVKPRGIHYYELYLTKLILSTVMKWKIAGLRGRENTLC